MIANNSAVRFLRWLGFASLSLVTACASVEVNEPMVQLKDERPEKFGVLVMGRRFLGPPAVSVSGGNCLRYGRRREH